MIFKACQVREFSVQAAQVAVGANGDGDGDAVQEDGDLRLKWLNDKARSECLRKCAVTHAVDWARNRLKKEASDSEIGDLEQRQQCCRIA